MTENQVEEITKAAQCADLLTSDIRQAHKAADRVTEIILRDLLSDAQRIKNRLEELQAAAQTELVV